MSRLLLSWLAGCALVGCMSPEERAARAAAYQAQLEVQEDAQCRSYGAEPGSQTYVQCRMLLQQQAAQAEAQRRAAIMQMLINRPQIQPVQLQTPALPSNQSVNCTTNYVGAQAFTHCN